MLACIHGKLYKQSVVMGTDRHIYLLLLIIPKSYRNRYGSHRMGLHIVATGWGLLLWPPDGAYYCSYWMGFAIVAYERLSWRLYRSVPPDDS